MSGVTTIQLEKRVVKELKEAREYPEQTYNTLIERMVMIFKKVKEREYFDPFLYRMQQFKMKEIWDNKYDEV
ncbi:hypothetical protein HY546_02055 [archaeon]|nr:hypothetical protein [archaeon]